MEPPPTSKTMTLKTQPDDFVAPESLAGLHAVEDQGKLASLVESMASDGWQGPPIPVIPGGRALAGVHRIAAAKISGIEVPVVWAPEGDYVDGYDDDDRLERLRWAIEDGEIDAEDAAETLHLLGWEAEKA